MVKMVAEVTLCIRPTSSIEQIAGNVIVVKADGRGLPRTRQVTSARARRWRR
jgi:hypothetical protein